MRSAAELHEPVVKSSHHRQFPEILAILLLVQRAVLARVLTDMTDGVQIRLQSLMTEDLLGWAVKYYTQSNDPHRLMFRILNDLIPLDHVGHLTPAFV